MQRQKTTPVADLPHDRRLDSLPGALLGQNPQVTHFYVFVYFITLTSLCFLPQVVTCFTLSGIMNYIRL